jgi:hypothetical protein
MADLAVSLAVAHRRERTLLRHVLGSPPLARLLLPRLAAAAPALFSPASKVAEEISHCLGAAATQENASTARGALASSAARRGGARDTGRGCNRASPLPLPLPLSTAAVTAAVTATAAAHGFPPVLRPSALAPPPGSRERRLGGRP